MAVPYVIATRTISREAFAAAYASPPLRPTHCEQTYHCWPAPHVWQGPLPALRTCYWCGSTEGPQHGPYAPGGG